jgi:hypothetical protein
VTNLETKFVWILPDNAKGEYVRSNIKYHCYEDGESLCGRWFYSGKPELEETIEGDKVIKNSNCCCKKCFQKYKRKLNI